MKLSVLQLIGNFEQGGSEQQAVQLTRLLHESGRFNVHVAVLDARGPLREQVEQMGLSHEINAYPLGSFYDANALRQLRRFADYLRANSIEVVQTHDFYSNVFGMAGAKLARTPARIAAKRETSGMRTFAQKHVQNVAFQLAHAVVANAEAVRRHLVSEGVPDRKIVTIYNGLDVKRLKAPVGVERKVILEDLGLPTDGQQFVTLIANLRHEVKDHPTFLRAARRVRDAVPNAAFVIAGEGELTERMRALATSLGISQQVHFIGRCNRIAELLAISNVGVLTSKAEGFSNAVLEYMAAGLPVVATDVGGVREAVQENETGFIIPVGDDEALASRIVSLLHDEKAAFAMGERGQRLVTQKFSCEAQLERTTQLYQRLVSHFEPAHSNILARNI